MNLIIFGPPGSGKGTQSKNLQDKFGLKKLSTGDLIRAEIAAHTETGQIFKEFVDKGNYPPDEMINDLVKKNYNSSLTGYIFDGHPRTLNQAIVLEQMLAEGHQKIDGVFNIVVSDEVIKKRVLGRYSCNTCGAIYNRYFYNPKKEGICDVCGGNDFNTRTDDTEETIEHRLKVHEQTTKPILTYFEQKTGVITIDGEQGVDEVKQQFESAVEQLLGKKEKVKWSNT